MATSTPALLKLGSHLGDRILWFDGSMTVEPDSILTHMRPNVRLHVTEMNTEIQSYNRFADRPIDVKTKLDISQIDPDQWNIPDSYNQIELESYFENKLSEWTGYDYERRKLRVEHELAAFRATDQEIVLRLMIYIVDTLMENDCVWGIGRGSSVSCFLLYLIGVHDIDSVEFDLSFKDFMKSA